MKGLLLKDCYTIKSSLKLFGIVLLVYIPLGVYMKSSLGITFVVLLFILNLILNVASSDEQSGWDRCALTMPVPKKKVVLERYAFVGLAALSALGVSGLGTGLTDQLIAGNGLAGLDASTAEAVFGNAFRNAYLTALGILLMSAVIIPVIYKVGTETGRYVLMGVYMVPVLLASLILKELSQEQQQFLMSRGLKLLCLVGPAIVAAALVISYFTSLKIYGKKEW